MGLFSEFTDPDIRETNKLDREAKSHQSIRDADFQEPPGDELKIRPFYNLQLWQGIYLRWAEAENPELLMPEPDAAIELARTNKGKNLRFLVKNGKEKGGRREIKFLEREETASGITSIVRVFDEEGAETAAFFLVRDWEMWGKRRYKTGEGKNAWEYIYMKRPPNKEGRKIFKLKR